MGRNRGRHGSKRFPSAPEKSAGAPPLLPLAAVQAQRLRELQLASGFSVLVVAFWRLMVDPELISQVADSVAPALPKRSRRELAATARLAANEGGCEPPVAMLCAATSWYARLRLPRTRLELWSGPPLCERQRASRADGLVIELGSPIHLASFVADSEVAGPPTSDGGRPGQSEHGRFRYLDPH